MIKNAEKNIKIYGLIIGITLFILLIAGLSYAYYQGKVEDTTTISGEVGMCFEVNYLKGGNVSGSDLLLLDKNEIINNNQITIRNGMAVTSISAGMDNTKCPNTYGYMNVYMKDTTLNNAFINGDSAGALKYVIASYDKNTYPTATVSTLKDKSFTIVKEGTVSDASNRLIFTDPMLSLGSMAHYLVIFYLDGDLTMNDGGDTSFSTTISATASPSVDGSAASYISNLSTPTSTVINNNITYNVNTTNNMITDIKDNVRFYGANPDNYIYFNCETYPDTNCETWRIIGVVDGKVKLMRSTSIGTYSWDTSASDVNSGKGYNNWNSADLMKLLNPGYEDNQDLNNAGETITVNNSLYYNSGSGTCYSGQSNATKACDFTNIGIKNDATRSKIAENTYYLKALPNGTGGFSDFMLNGERGTNIWNGKVAMPYPSDYGYAADFHFCTVWTFNYGGNSGCSQNNWITAFINAITWFVSPNGWGQVMIIWSSGDVFGSNPSWQYSANQVFPSVYLSDTEIITGGSGTESNPYRLG